MDSATLSVLFQNLGPHVVLVIIVFIGLWKAGIFNFLKDAVPFMTHMKQTVEEIKASDKEQSAKLDHVMKDVDALQTRMDEADKAQRSVLMETLKQQVFSELPLKDRLYAGARYLALGGNSTTKVKLAELANENWDCWCVAAQSQGVDPEVLRACS